ncbi:MAG: lipoyl(octanoyl) transferase LipB [Pseudanabaena sp. CRU_2_10]|nr:lipoyl(octanoyl) transferase LipB [Pseudanabaena sp. CRU_2_10]
MRQCLLYQSDRPIPYLTAWQWQKDLVEARKQDASLPDVLLLIEHPPVYTLGQGSSLEFLKFELDTPGIECHRIERGGEVTYHAPGQIVGYPILNLNFYQRDLHWYLRQLEEVIIMTLAKYNVTSERISGLTGVWVRGEKIAQVGIKVSRWITMHGFALNVSMDLAGFDRIVPCGISDRSCCHLAQFVPNPGVQQVREAITQSFATVFDVNFKHLPGDLESVG